MSRADQPLHGDGPATSRRERARLRREEIILIAAELFAERGYRGTSLADVAARAGITEPGLLHHFGNKAGLLLAVIERRDLDSEAFAMELLGMEPADRLRALPEFARRNKYRAGLAKLFTVLVAESLEPDAPGHDHFVARYRAMRAIVADTVRAAQRTGLTRAGLDPEAKAAEIIATLDGLQTQWLLDPEAVDIVAAVESYARTLERDLTGS
ncbi:TetR/AcrR family transcriptional regulator [Nonomuraea muscovyensis]|jgi:AcrR family transcriptional regulator|uniref:AcrR family transcriptional regulator n=1 Tax=Nonomuraea muscovyensis TaxID=1124761 RepID=A0A7X0CA50_9ACTN|nr:TetR/AcrR family transcriptional regulator [Nonomuraea muscovyensis]MBB6351112.1 AcrR family transcriptional regulator [Nonomuraea muscovyensis]MDF2710971.1 TetR family transcriptional regulator [Nonomuraea muscovyensis]